MWRSGPLPTNNIYDLLKIGSGKYVKSNYLLEFPSSSEADEPTALLPVPSPEWLLDAPLKCMNKYIKH